MGMPATTAVTTLTSTSATNACSLSTMIRTQQRDGRRRDQQEGDAP